jgi:nucleotide-binding universal stress UspA family protein
MTTDSAGEATLGRIVVGVDGSEASARAFAWALDEARRRHCAIDAVYAWQVPYLVGYPYPGTDGTTVTYQQAASGVLDRVVDAAETSGLPVPISRVLVMGHPVVTILEQAKGADMIVLGSRGYGGFRGLLLGSVSQQVVHHAHCPVVIIPAGE